MTIGLALFLKLLLYSVQKIINDYLKYCPNKERFIDNLSILLSS